MEQSPVYCLPSVPSETEIHNTSKIMPIDKAILQGTQILSKPEKLVHSSVPQRQTKVSISVERPSPNCFKKEITPDDNDYNCKLYPEINFKLPLALK